MQILIALDFTIKLDLAAVNTMSELVRNRAATLDILFDEISTSNYLQIAIVFGLQTL